METLKIYYSGSLSNCYFQTEGMKKKCFDSLSYEQLKFSLIGPLTGDFGLHYPLIVYSFMHPGIHSTVWKVLTFSPRLNMNTHTKSRFLPRILILKSCEQHKLVTINQFPILKNLV